MKHSILFCFLFLSSTMFSQKVYDEIFHEYDNAIVNFDELIMGDLDGQGRPDFVAVSYSKKKIYVGLTQGTDKPILNVIDDEFRTSDVIMYDFDDDGDNDIIGSVLFEDRTYLWSNDGAGNFTRSELALEGYKAIHFRDLDDDGFDELIIGIDDQLRIYLLNAGVITFQQIVHEEEFGGTPDAITTYDENFDNFYDIAATYKIGGIRIFEQDLNVPLVFTDFDIEPNEFNNDKLVVTDLDNDLKVDMIAHSQFDGKTTLFMNNGDGTFESSIFPSPNGRNEYSHFKDYDGDGDMDIIYIEEDGNDATISVLQNDAGEFVKKVIITKDYAQTYTGGVEDIDNDGDKDLFFGTNDVAGGGILLFTNTGVSSVEDPIITKANIQPTLFDGQFTILEEGTYNYMISNIAGRIVERGVANGYATINGSTWDPGVYIVTLQKEGTLIRNTVFKQ